MVRFVGQGPAFARRELFHRGNSVDFDFYGSNVNFTFVDSYKHMDIYFSMSFDMSQEVVVRAAIIRSCARALKPILSNPRLALAKKMSFVKAHLFASGLFQCSTWGPLSTPLYSKIHSVVGQVHRIATKNVINPSCVSFIL